jgi:hypothetical protein
VSCEPFLFSLKLADYPRVDVMLDSLAECVLKNTGYAPAAIADILATLRGALDGHAAKGHTGCDLQVRAEAGQLVIVLTGAGGPEWRMARALPD